MLLDVQEVGRLTEGRDVPVEMAHPPVDGWISRPDVAQVALEMLNVDGVEADNRREPVLMVSIAVFPLSSQDVGR